MKRIPLPALVCLLAGCSVAAPPAAKPYPDPPPPPVESMPLPPVSGTPLTWQPGHYDWTGSTYAWVPGRWVERAGHGTLWQDGYWSFDGGGWRWIPGHWM